MSDSSVGARAAGGRKREGRQQEQQQREQQPKGPLAGAVLRTNDYLANHAVARWTVIIVLIVITIPPGVYLLFNRSFLTQIEGLVFVGVFVINWLLNLSIIPIPGASSLGQAVIIRRAEASSVPWLIGLAGGLGMGLGEIPPYFLGYFGVQSAQGRDIPGPSWVEKPVRWVIDGINTLMKRWGVPTVFLLSAIPNPVLEVAAVSAGAARMGFWKFLIPEVAGKLVRGMLLVYLGSKIPFV